LFRDSREVAVAYYLGLVYLLVCLLAYLVWQVFRSRHRLEFVRPDGKRCSLYFRFQGRKPRQRFTKLLKQYRTIASAPGESDAGAARGIYEDQPNGAVGHELES
jgi:hypothetical protein